MYLLQIDPKGNFSLVEKYADQIPPYGILSHTWIATHEEVTFKDIMKGRGKEKRGYEKLRFCAKQATHDRLDYFWIDTCCIDKSSSAELQEAINSMFGWYQNSARCYVYLEDVSLQDPNPDLTGHGWRSAFRRSRWFTRGWTLQELLAPTSVEFFTREGASIGDKHSLWQDINEATTITPQVLHGNVYSLYQVPINTRLGWARDRQTTREEDKCYSLLGLFNVHMSLLYGEGRVKAFRRFHEELKKDREDPTELNAILAQVQARHAQVHGQQIENDKDIEIMPDNRMKRMPPKRSATEAFEDATGLSVRDASRPSWPSETRPSAAEAMETRVIDADLQVRAISEETHTSEPPSEQLDAEVGQEQEQAQDMQRWWNAGISQKMHKPEVYHHVAVLLIRWADKLDELKTSEEVNDLEATLRETFGYETEALELSLKTRPQLQLNSRISSFAEKHNGPNNLIIVYYTGHAIWRDLENYLEITACSYPSMMRGWLKDAHARWDKAEQILQAEDIDADTLIILDACYASNMTKGRKMSTNSVLRKFELLSASPIDETTAAPGPYSFTRTLIDSLRSLAREHGNKPFSTSQLNQRIRMDKRRHDTPSQLWYRLPNYESILLAPMHNQRKLNGLVVLPQSRSRLTLSFDLRDATLNREQIEYLATCISNVVQHKYLLGIRKINWHGIKPAAQDTSREVAIAKRVFAKWRKAVPRLREERGNADLIG